MQITPLNNSDETVKIYTPLPKIRKGPLQTTHSDDSDNVRIYSIRSQAQADSSSDNSSHK